MNHLKIFTVIALCIISMSSCSKDTWSVSLSSWNNNIDQANQTAPSNPNGSQILIQDERQPENWNTTQNELEALNKASTPEEIKEIVKTKGEKMNFWDESLEDEIYENDVYSIAHLYDVCSSAWELDLWSLVEWYYEISSDDILWKDAMYKWISYEWKTAVDILMSEDWEDYCSNPVFWNEDYKTCYTSFDWDFLNAVIRVYLWKSPESSFETYLENLNPRSDKEKVLKNIFKKVLNNEIQSRDDCFK